jgi:hypothetical protein
MMLFAVVFKVIPFTPGTYTNEKYGFSISFPLDWEDATKEDSSCSGLVVHAREKNGFAAINIIAGPQLYGPHPTIDDIELQARINVKNLRGTLETIQKITINTTDAVMAVYTVYPVKTRKVGLVKDNIEFIITCSSLIDIFPVYDPIFVDCIQSMNWLHEPKQSVVPLSR